MAEPVSPAATVPPAAAKVPEPLRPIPPALRPLRYLGIPDGVLRYRPKPPSRNTSIFLVVTSTLLSLWYYDRRECDRIRQQYIDAVKPYAEQPLASFAYPRKVQVIGAKSPGDDDYDKSILFFRKYIKPYLVAAAVDYEMLNGLTHGGLSREIRERTYARRRQLAGLEPWGIDPSSSGALPPTPDSTEVMGAQLLLSLPFALKPEQQLQRELDGATIIVGRPAYKEYMDGLRQGWTTTLPPQRQDLDDGLAEQLADDGKFDEVAYENEKAAKSSAETAPSETLTSGATAADDGEIDEIERRNRALAASAEDAEDDAGAPIPLTAGGPRPGGSPFGLAGSQKGGFNGAGKRSSSAPVPAVDPALLAAPAKIPAQAPLVFADYVNLAGWRMIPRRMVDFFNHRERVRYGGQVALAIIQGDKTTAREFEAPLNASRDDVPPQGGDLDWGRDGEEYYPPRFFKLPKLISEEREAYYNNLQERLKDTRTLVRGLREPSKAEKTDPPTTEGELRAERLRKEKSWRFGEHGFDILRPDRGVAWAEAFRGSLRVFPVEAQGSPPEPAVAAEETAPMSS